MNNIVLLLIDSMNYSHMKESPVELTPFINELKQKGVFCENMFSQAPYTEAANMSIYCGNDVLQNGGYMFRYKDAPMTIFEAMKEKGYKTYYNDFQPQCHPSSVRRGIDEIYYSVGFDLQALWSYRLSHYASLLKNKQINQEDYKVLIEIFDDNFSEWIRFADAILQKDKSTNLIYGNAKNYDAKNIKQTVEKEFEEYKSDSIKYIHEVLIQGQKHRLFDIPAYVQDNKIKDREIVQFVRTEYRPLIKRIKRMDFWLNLKNCKGLLKGPLRKLGQLIRKPSMITLKNFAKSGLLSWNQLFDSDINQRIDEDCDRFKNAPSLRKHIDHYINWIETTNDSEQHFAFFHVDDIHNPEVFFTYDSEDKDLLRKEKEEAMSLLDSIPGSYSGSLSHDLSLRYIDGVIKYLYEQLEAQGKLDNTYIAICADHGFSFSGNPLRDSFVINLYLENYNIPFIITGPDLEKKEINNLCESKDIPATLCDLADGVIPDYFTGKSVLDGHDYENVQIEYCGGGCPDLSRREIKLAAFNKSYFVGTLAKLEEDIDDSNITEVYDLEKDYKQIKNMKANYDKEKAQPLINMINKRKKEILEYTKRDKENK